MSRLAARRPARASSETGPEAIVGAVGWERRLRMGRLLRLAATVLACVAPLLVSLVWKVLVEPRPFWAHFYDPEAIYFFEGFRLLDGSPPANVDNPGTPVQALSAALVAWSDRDPLAFESFRLAAYALAFAFFALAVVLLLETWLAGAAPSTQVLAIWTWFLAPAALEYACVWSPESLVFPVGAVLLAALYHATRANRGPIRYLALGGASGLALAVKLTFLPLVVAAALAALVPSKGRSARHWTIASTSLAGGLLAGFVVATLPAAGAYGRMFDLVTRLLTSSGAYGTGAQGLPDASSVASNLLAGLLGAKTWWAWLLLVAFASWWIRRQQAPVHSDSVAPLAVAAALSLALGIVVIHRHFAPRYMLPSQIGGVGLAMVFASTSVGTRWRLARAGALAVVTALLVRQGLFDVANHRERIRTARQTNAEIEALVAQACRSGGPPVVIFGFRAPEPSLALRVMTTDPVLHARIEEAYPRRGHVDWSRRIVPPRSAGTPDLLVVRDADFEGVLRESGLAGEIVGRSGSYSVARVGMPGEPLGCDGEDGGEP